MIGSRNGLSHNGGKIILFVGLTYVLHSLPAAVTSSQGLSMDEARRFVQALVLDSDSLPNHVLPEELTLSERLGITYTGVQHKFLIGYDLDPQVKTAIREGALDYGLQVDNLEGDFSRLRLTVTGQRELERSFYFEGTQLVSPVYYFSRDWPRRNSRYFVFCISDTTRFNSASEIRLEDFMESVLNQLDFPNQAKEKLEREKLYYFFCKDQEEIKLLTGFASRGMGLLAYDYVISTFNCHYHELVHLLVNLKLGCVPLYTHPFLQEGIAVALGGRGGNEPRVILDLGWFLAQSGFADYRSLLDPQGFADLDPSASYPLCGLYSSFLLEELGVEDYLALYGEYSGTAEEISANAIEEGDLPAHDRWMEFLNSYKQYEKINFCAPPADPEPILEAPGASILEADDRYYFRMKGALLIGVDFAARDYRSSRFEELVTSGVYLGQKYLVLANPQEIKVYNLLTDNLIANFVCGFSLTVERIKADEKGHFEFCVSKDLFDEPLGEMVIDLYSPD